MQRPPLLDIQNISIHYHTKRGSLEAVHQASFSIDHQTSVAVIGESGCGKTTLATSIVQMLSRNASIVEGSIWFAPEGQKSIDLTKLNENQMRPLRWNNIVMMFQASQSSFNPVAKIYTQFLDTAKAHENPYEPEKVLARAKKLLELVYLDSETVLNAYPHELSGGMKQRTLIALSLLLDPQLVILDEPTTALDLITQKKILRLLNELRSSQGFSMMFITHDLGIVTQLSDRVVTMYAGTVVENSPTKAFFSDPKHPYSKGLLKAIPSLDASFEQLYSIPGSTPDLVEKMQGCLFAPRCELCHQRCKIEVPRLKQVGPDRWAACHALKEAPNGTH
ncbi:MAG TPA: peptide ABC transporter ATP-binding protein [Sphaerochaeta sp.]|jgi:peptide/nickel transport system ATP-binding protein|nr:ABC transporter ATP-binding protein [Sphaerochaeta sp.]HBO36334.1 peptide ABC transporter ATP-binding protein [Sphaerochaeta sp.]